MIITFQKPGYIRLQSGTVSIDIDPPTARTKADVVIRTAVVGGDESSLLSVGEIGCAGEYEMKDIGIRGYQATGESTPQRVKTIYRIEWEDLTFAVLGELSEMPEGNIMKEISEVDVLFVPTGDKGSLSPEVAAKIVRQIEPSVVIPTHFKEWQGFAKELGATKTAPSEKFVFKKKELVPKEGKLVVIEG